MCLLQVISDAMRTQCFRSFRKIGSPSHNFSVVKTFQKCNHRDFKLYLSMLTNTNFPIWFNLVFGLFSMLFCIV